MAVAAWPLVSFQFRAAERFSPLCSGRRIKNYISIDEQGGFHHVLYVNEHALAEIQKPFQSLLAERDVPERSQPYFLHWAMTWLAKVGQTSDEPDTRRFFEDLGRRPGLRDWQFVQAVRAVAWMAREILRLPWTFLLAEHAKSAEEIMTENEIGQIVLSRAIRLHRDLGPGLLESVYEILLADDLKRHGLSVEQQVPVPLEYNGRRFEPGFRADILVENKVILAPRSLRALREKYYHHHDLSACHETPRRRKSKSPRHELIQPVRDPEPRIGPRMGLATDRTRNYFAACDVRWTKSARSGDVSRVLHSAPCNTLQKLRAAQLYCSATGMKTIGIAKVSKLDDGRLTVCPATIPPLCEYIYRAAAGVSWNKDLSCFQSAVPQDWDYRKWFGQIVSVVRSELGIRLDLMADTEFDSSETDFKAEVISANTDVQRWISEQEQKRQKPD